MIEVKNLTKRYGTNTALNNVSFTVEEGTIVGFLGPNGAGKSTTMNIITGYLSATSGSVTVQGKNTLENPNEVKKLIGYLPELPPLSERMETALRQFALAVQDKGEYIACLEARKHFAWYLRGVAHSSYYKEKISAIRTVAEARAIISGIQRDLR